MGNILRTNGGLVIDRPGNVLFVPVHSDGTLDYASAIRNTAKINTITVTNSKTKTEIQDGNAFYPAGDRVTAITGTVAIEFTTIDPAIWAMCSGTEFINKSSDTMTKMYEYQKIGEDNQIICDEAYKTNGFVQVLAADGTVFEKVNATPGEGEFTVSASGGETTFTFAAADANKSVMITMEVIANTMSYSQGRKAMKNHKIIIDTEYSTLSDSDKIPVNVIISQASVSGDMVDALQKDPSATKTLTFTMYAPLPGEQPYEVKMKDTATTKRLIDIEVTTAPTKTSYTAGESFAPTGMVVTATYSDGTTSAVTGYSYSPAGALTTADKVVTITYQGKVASQVITVSAS